MAARKEVPAERATFTMDLEASDLPRPRMRVVTPLGKYQTMRPKMFATGDIVIGNAADDVDAERVYSVDADADPGVLVYILDHGKSLTVDKDAQGKAIDFQRYEFGDPEAPSYAKTVHDYVVLAPEHDTMLPVMISMTPGSRSAIGAINMAMMRAQAQGKDPRTIAFRLTTATKTGGGNTWDAIVATAVEPDEKLQLMATTMGDQLVPVQRQLAQSNEPAEAAAF